MWACGATSAPQLAVYGRRRASDLNTERPHGGLQTPTGGAYRRQNVGALYDLNGRRRCTRHVRNARRRRLNTVGSV
jgi:hypothetical protein